MKLRRHNELDYHYYCSSLKLLVLYETGLQTKACDVLGCTKFETFVYGDEKNIILLTGGFAD